MPEKERTRRSTAKPAIEPSTEHLAQPRLLPRAACPHLRAMLPADGARGRSLSQRGFTTSPPSFTKLASPASSAQKSSTRLWLKLHLALMVSLGIIFNNQIPRNLSGFFFTNYDISKRLYQGEVYCQRCHGQKFPSDGGKIWSDPSLIVATDGKGCPR